MRYFFLLFLFLPFGVRAGSINDLDDGMVMTAIPKGTEIPINLPSEIVSKPLPHLGGSRYGTNLYFKNGVWQTERPKLGPTERLCVLSLSQYDSPKIDPASSRLTFKVEETKRNPDYGKRIRNTWKKTLRSNVIDLSPVYSVGTKRRISGTLVCESGNLSGSFKSLNVKHLKTSLGNTLGRPAAAPQRTVQRSGGSNR